MDLNTESTAGNHTIDLRVFSDRNFQASKSVETRSRRRRIRIGNPSDRKACCSGTKTDVCPLPCGLPTGSAGNTTRTVKHLLHNLHFPGKE